MRNNQQKEQERKIETFLQAFKNFSWISVSCIIYRILTANAQINWSYLQFDVDHLSDKISFPSTKQ